MSPTALRMLAVLALGVSALSACAPTPEPTPTPSPAFASEEEAFAAAEATYRDYNDAGNSRRNGEGGDPSEFLIGAALDADPAAAENLKASGLRVVGTVDVIAFTSVGTNISPEAVTVEALVCLDTSGTKLLNEQGQDVSAENRKTTIASIVQMVTVGGSLYIEAERAAEADEC